MAGKSSPALFELIGGAQAKPVRVVVPTPKPEPIETPRVELPRPEPRERPQPPVERRPPAPRTSSGFDAGRAMVVPLGGLYIGITVVLGLLVIVWSAAFNLGYNRAEEEARRDIAAMERGNGVREPANAEPVLTGESTAATPSADGTGAPTPAIQDPRTEGHNYLHVATLDRGEAERLIGFLAENSLRAIAVPVDRTGRGANNPVKFDVFTLDGVPGGSEFRASAGKRTEIEASVGRLGKVWQRDHKGTTDLSKTQWTKYKR